MILQKMGRMPLERATKIAVISLMIIMLCASRLDAQALNDEWKKKFREDIAIPDTSTHPLQQQWSAKRPLTQLQEQKVIKVSPSTRLPTRIDRIQLLNPPPTDIEKIIDLRTTHTRKSQVERNMTNYSSGKYIPIPDANSISQWCQHTGSGYDTKLKLNIDIAELAPWIQEILRITAPFREGFDADIVRNIKENKEKKHRQKLKKILDAY